LRTDAQNIFYVEYDRRSAVVLVPSYMMAAQVRDPARGLTAPNVAIRELCAVYHTNRRDYLSWLGPNEYRPQQVVTPETLQANFADIERRVLAEAPRLFGDAPAPEQQVPAQPTRWTLAWPQFNAQPAETPQAPENERWMRNLFLAEQQGQQNAAVNVWVQAGTTMARMRAANFEALDIER
jgi:hypothetical protein